MEKLLRNAGRIARRRLMMRCLAHDSPAGRKPENALIDWPVTGRTFREGGPDRSLREGRRERRSQNHSRREGGGETSGERRSARATRRLRPRGRSRRQQDNALPGKVAGQLRRENRRHGGGDRQKAAGGAVVAIVVLIMPARLARGDLLRCEVLSVIGMVMALMMSPAMADAPVVPVRE